jgi:hypothetical protein
MNKYLTAIRSDRDILVGLIICLLAVLALVQSYLGLTRPVEMIEAYGVSDVVTEGQMIITSSGGLLLGFATIGTTIYWKRYHGDFDSGYYFSISVYSVFGVFGAVVLPFILTGALAIALFIIHYSWGELAGTILKYRRKIRGEEIKQEE